MRLALLFAIGCVTADDYAEPAVGLTATGAAEMCRQNVYLSCGWVYDFQGGEIEFCLPWEDRSPIPKLMQTAESLYGDGILSVDPRFRGTPICYWQCPGARSCNARSGCFCLESAP